MSQQDPPRSRPVQPRESGALWAVLRTPWPLGHLVCSLAVLRLHDSRLLPSLRSGMRWPWPLLFLGSWGNSASALLPPSVGKTPSSALSLSPRGLWLADQPWAGWLTCMPGAWARHWGQREGQRPQPGHGPHSAPAAPPHSNRSLLSLSEVGRPGAHHPLRVLHSDHEVSARSPRWLSDASIYLLL